jgi:CBS domain-containing protein
MRRVLAEIPASKVMSDGTVEIPGDMSIEQAVDEYFLRHDFNAFPVRVSGETVGILSMSAVRQIPREEWSSRSVGDEAEPLSEACTVSPSEPLDSVVGKLMSGDLRRAVVVEDGQVIGIVTPRDLSRWLQRSQELGLTETAGV